jgi:4-hydroxybenzoate polyprenyltransferase
VEVGQLIPAAIGLSLVSIAIYVLNGIIDLTGDIVNGSARPLASGRLPLRFAEQAVIAAAVAGQLIAFEGGLAAGLCVAVMLLVGTRYSAGSRAWKNHPLPAAVSVILMGCSTYGVALFVTAHPPLLTLALPAAAMSLWMGLVGAGSKDFADAAGDALTGRRVPRGSHARACRRRVTAGAFGIAAGYCAAVIWLRHSLLPSAAMLAFAAILVAISSWRCPLFGERQVLRRTYRVFMWAQYLVHITLLAPPLI